MKSAEDLHELSLVQGILDAVQETASERGGRVMSFTVEVGELAQFDIRLVRRLIQELKRGTSLEGAKAVIEREKSKIKCLSCGRVWTFKDLAEPLSGAEKEMVHFLPELVSSASKCPACSKSFFEIEEGRSVRVSEVVLDA